MLFHCDNNQLTILKLSTVPQDNKSYYISINDTSFVLSVFWTTDTESQINELRLSDSVSLSFKMRLTWLPVFAATLRKIRGTRDETMMT